MADSPPIELHFRGTCPDCGVREVHLPAPLANGGDDFDWRHCLAYCENSSKYTCELVNLSF